MPLKTCANCKAQVGPRSLRCFSCQTPFIVNGEKTKRKKGSLPVNVPEPGQWTFDIPSGMPRPRTPDPLPREGLLTNEEVYEKVSYEGLGFCVYTYIPADRIKDQKLKELWKECRATMRQITEILASSVQS
jgi:hypothetical protein